MNEIEISVTGNVCSEVSQHDYAGGRFTRFSVACTPRLFKEGRWSDGPTSFFRVGCFGNLGANVFASVHKGDPVLVRGRVTVRNWESDGVTRTSVDINADSVGHDLRFGGAVFQRARREAASTDDAPWSAVPAELAQEGRDAGLSANRVQADAAGVAG